MTSFAFSPKQTLSQGFKCDEFIGEVIPVECGKGARERVKLKKDVLSHRLLLRAVAPRASWGPTETLGATPEKNLMKLVSVVPSVLAPQHF